MSQAVKKQALGRGLSALLKDPENNIQSVNDKNAEKLVGHIIELDIDAIEINPFQPRSNFNEESLQELAMSIRELGVIQPITVRKIDFNQYQLGNLSVPGNLPRYINCSELSDARNARAFFYSINSDELGYVRTAAQSRGGKGLRLSRARPSNGRLIPAR